MWSCVKNTLTWILILILIIRREIFVEKYRGAAYGNAARVWLGQLYGPGCVVHEILLQTSLFLSQKKVFDRCTLLIATVRCSSNIWIWLLQLIMHMHSSCISREVHSQSEFGRTQYYRWTEMRWIRKQSLVMSSSPHQHNIHKDFLHKKLQTWQWTTSNGVNKSQLLVKEPCNRASDTVCDDITCTNNCSVRCHCAGNLTQGTVQVGWIKFT